MSTLEYLGIPAYTFKQNVNDWAGLYGFYSLLSFQLISLYLGMPQKGLPVTH